MSPCKLTNQAVVRRLMHSLYHCLSWLSSIGISLIIILNNNNDHFQHEYSQKVLMSALRIRRTRGLHLQKSSNFMFYTQSRYGYIGAIQKPNKAYIYIKLHTHTHARNHAHILTPPPPLPKKKKTTTKNHNPISKNIRGAYVDVLTII